MVTRRGVIYEKFISIAEYLPIPIYSPMPGRILWNAEQGTTEKMKFATRLLNPKVEHHIKRARQSTLSFAPRSLKRYFPLRFSN